MSQKPHTLSVTAAATAIAAGNFTSEALVASCLERIAEREPAVLAFAYYDADAALAAARRLDGMAPSGPLHGIPVGIKDIIDTADMPTECNSPIYAGHRPAQDATCVARLRRAGAIILGKTVTTEFASTHPGPTRHPRNPERTPGGSSSGSAAAVGDTMLPLALGTQTGGSVIRPSAFNGVVGYKPAWGLYDTAGVKPLAVALDTIGFMTRSLDDVPLVSGVLADRPATVPATVENPKIAVVRGGEWDQADPEMQALLENTAARLGAAGATVRDVALPEPFGRIAAIQRVLMAAGAADAFQHEWATNREKLSDPFQTLVATGLKFTDAEKTEAAAVAEQCRARLPNLFDANEIILTPSAPGEAPLGLHSTGNSVFNRVWTTLHVPCLTIPVQDGPNGLPLGVQFVEPLSDEANLLGGARWAARALDLPLFG
ncbi:MAG: amidase [Alphaproteobacteria bacterium]|nr:amidase [Alphaproteobacteria bacterium]